MIKETEMIRIPKRFVDDHADRDLDTPVILRQNKTSYYIDPSDEALPELISDAWHYVDCIDEPDCRWLVGAAARLLGALSKGGVEIGTSS